MHRKRKMFYGKQKEVEFPSCRKILFSDGEKEDSTGMHIINFLLVKKNPLCKGFRNKEFVWAQLFFWQARSVKKLKCTDVNMKRHEGSVLWGSPVFCEHVIFFSFSEVSDRCTDTIDVFFSVSLIKKWKARTVKKAAGTA